MKVSLILNNLLQHSQFTARLLTAHASFSIHLCRPGTLVVYTSQQSALVEILSARRHIDGRVLGEEVDGLEADLENFAWHHGEILDAWDLCSENTIRLARAAR